MRFFSRGGVIVLPILGIAMLSGCSGSRAVVAQGQRAEKKQDYRDAYQCYLRAARTNPGNGAVEEAMHRVAPLASQYWLEAGRQFERSAQHDLAWRCYMRALYIYPCNKSALDGIRRLERDEPGRVAAAQLAYQRYGARSLEVGRVEVATPIVATATPGGAAEKTGSRRILDDSASTRRPAEPTRSTTNWQSSRVARSAPDAPTPQVAHADTAEASPAGEMESPAVEMTPPSESPPAEIEREKITPPPNPSFEQTRSFLRTAIASREDDRFPKTVALGDDIRLRVLDTDPDPDADVAIYRGKRRIQKIENWRVGESVGITGRSGRGYEVQLISIFDSTETVRVGIRPLPSRDS